jgi:hypothetical protein
MSIDSCLPPHLDEILEDSRARNPDLSYDDATPAQDNIVSDLNQVIETRAGADYCIVRGASIDRCICSNLDIVFQDHPA